MENNKDDKKKGKKKASIKKEPLPKTEPTQKGFKLPPFMFGELGKSESPKPNSNMEQVEHLIKQIDTKIKESKHQHNNGCECNCKNDLFNNLKTLFPNLPPEQQTLIITDLLDSSFMLSTLLNSLIQLLCIKNIMTPAEIAILNEFNIFKINNKIEQKLKDLPKDKHNGSI